MPHDESEDVHKCTVSIMKYSSLAVLFMLITGALTEVGCISVFLSVMFYHEISVFAMLGMLSPASRGALMTAGIFLFMFMG